MLVTEQMTVSSLSLRSRVLAGTGCLHAFQAVYFDDFKVPDLADNVPGFDIVPLATYRS